MDQSIIKWKENVTEKQLHLLAFVLITLKCGWKQIQFQHFAVEDTEQVEKNKLLVITGLNCNTESRVLDMLAKILCSSFLSANS